MPKIASNTTRRRAAPEPSTSAHRRPRHRLGQPRRAAARATPARRTVAPHDLARVAVERRARRRQRDDRRGGEPPAADRGADPLAGEVARQPRGVADQAEAGAGEPPRRLAPDDIAWPLNGSIASVAGSRPEARSAAISASRRRGACRRRRPCTPMPILMKSLLGEVPAVAAQVGLDVELGRGHEAPRPRPRSGGQPRLALLRHHDLLALGDLARARAPPGSDGRPRRSPAAPRTRPARSRRATPLAPRGDRRHPHAPAHVGAGGGRALEQVVIELAADDPVAGRPPPARPWRAPRTPARSGRTAGWSAGTSRDPPRGRPAPPASPSPRRSSRAGTPRRRAPGAAARRGPAARPRCSRPARRRPRWRRARPRRPRSDLGGDRRVSGAAHLAVPRPRWPPASP